MPLAAIKSFAQKTGKSEAEIEKYWEEAKAIVDKEYSKTKESEKYYGTAMNILKNKLKKHAGLKESRLEMFLSQDKVITESVEDADFVEEFLKSGRAYEDGFTVDDADPKELEMGVKVEMEHTSNKMISQRIALDHLAECKDYYTRLAKMEKECGVED